MLSELFSSKDSSRSQRAQKNILILFVIQVFNFFTLMAMVPVSISYLGSIDYGIWLTLASILSWLINLDFGIGNGLRNKLTEALALKDIKLARNYVSTAYAVFTVGVITALLFYLLFHKLLNWASLLNAPPAYLELLNTLVLYVIVLFLIQFLLKLITSVINADQSPALNGLLSLLINSLTLIIILFISEFTEKSLFLFGIITSVVPVIIFLFASLILFSGKYKKISPLFRFIDFRYSSSLVKLGLQFFIIQISSLIIFTTDNIIITQLFGPEPVVIYNIAYKYFYMVPLVFNVILAPFWSAFTDAYVTQDFLWIKRAIHKLIFIWVILSVVAILMIFFSNFIYRIWVGENISVPVMISIATGIFVIVANWNNIFTTFVYGVGKLRIQVVYSIFTAILNIPLSIFLAKTIGLGITGVMIATIICLIFSSLLSPLQYFKLINGKTKGIWNK